MSYLNPQSWTDVDFAGNPLNWSSREHKQTYPGYEMLRKALVERCGVSSTAVPAVLNTARASGRIYTGDWFINFHNTISTLIPKFVNHTDNGGDWTDLVPPAVIAPYWTEAGVLAEIGDPSRVAVPDIPTAEWSIQQRKILNELRWTRSGSSFLQQYRRTSGWQPFNADWPTTWADVVTAYNAATFDPVGGYSNSSYAAKDAVPARALALRNKTKITATLPAVAFSGSIDVYLLEQGWTPPCRIFDDEGLGFNNHAYWLFQTFGPQPGGTTVTTDYPSNESAVPSEPPDPGGPCGIVEEGWSLASSVVVFRWNVASGFKFVP